MEYLEFQALKTVFNEFKIQSSMYSLNEGNKEGAVCIVRREYDWEIYNCQSNGKENYHTFHTLSHGCYIAIHRVSSTLQEQTTMAHFYTKILHELEIINTLKKVVSDYGLSTDLVKIESRFYKYWEVYDVIDKTKFKSKIFESLDDACMEFLSRVTENYHLKDQLIKDFIISKKLA